MTSEQKLFDALETFTPKSTSKRRDTLPDLFRNIEKAQDNNKTNDNDINSTDKKRQLELHGGFITATQLEECKRIKLDNTRKQSTIKSFFTNNSEVRTGDDGDKQVIEATNKMEDNNLSKEDKFKMLFGDDDDDNNSSNVDGEVKANGDDRVKENEKKHEENDKKQRDHKHAKRKLERENRKRKCEEIKGVEENGEEISDKKQCTKNNDGKVVSENGAASGSVLVNKKERKRPKLKKSEIGTLVVKLLTPAYAERRFDSRDTFKTTARNISHALLDKGGLLMEVFFIFGTRYFSEQIKYTFSLHFCYIYTFSKTKQDIEVFYKRDFV